MSKSASSQSKQETVESSSVRGSILVALTATSSLQL